MKVLVGLLLPAALLLSLLTCNDPHNFVGYRAQHEVVRRLSITNPGSQTVREAFDFVPGVRSFHLASREGRDRISVKLHNRDWYEGFPASE